ncbi:MAG: metallopeptidase family protein [Gaiellaceae bacterium]|jgi:predicted Zn-dependent protease with MMP-like domain
MAFEDEVKRALDELPPDLAQGLRNVAILIEDEQPGNPGLLGLYQGVPLPKRRSGEPVQPDTITIFRRPLERIYRDPNELKEQIRVTVLHELAHYFGIDEERLAELGYG